ncbi:MFS transporter [Microlunatus endophyticus]|uniref:MFS transporter n=1 Tax=Microlunatus endophyticus TaxID=1716077 RepID=A0A917S4Z1_9ACTN|nr:MFS transporter [Microlunatus endophyticus]GGL58446.1 MFS transporter [Microlunatus endophyticus]
MTSPTTVPLQRNRQFQLLWTGAAASMLGSQLTRVATPLLLLAITGSPGKAGLVSAVGIVGMLVLQMPAGVLVDRSDRRRSLSITQAAQVINSAALMIMLLSGRAGLWNFIMFSIIDGGCQAFLSPARNVAIRNVVPSAQLRQAYTQEEARSHGTRLLGPVLGGALYAANSLLPFVLDTLSFLIAWVCTVIGRVPRQPPVTAGGDQEVAPSGQRRTHMVAEAVEAARWIVRQRGMREMILVVTAMNLLGGAFSIPVIVHVRELGGSSTITGLVLTGSGIGGLVGAVLAGQITGRIPAGRLAAIVPAVFGICMAAAALPLADWWPIIPIVIFSLIIPSLNITLATITAQLVPPEMLGRLGSLLGFTAYGLQPLGPLLGGVLSQMIGGGPTLLCVGIGLLLTAGAAASSRSLRTFRSDASENLAA